MNKKKVYLLYNCTALESKSKYTCCQNIFFISHDTRKTHYFADQCGKIVQTLNKSHLNASVNTIESESQRAYNRILIPALPSEYSAFQRMGQVFFYSIAHKYCWNRSPKYRWNGFQGKDHWNVAPKKQTDRWSATLQECGVEMSLEWHPLPSLHLHIKNKYTLSHRY